MYVHTDIPFIHFPPSTYLFWFFVLSRPLALPLPLVCCCCYIPDSSHLVQAAIPWAPAPYFLPQSSCSCSLPLPLFPSLTLLPALPLTALWPELLLDSLEGRGCLKLLGRGFHSPTLLTPEPAKGTKYSVKKVGSQRTTSVTGIEISKSDSYSPIHKFPGEFTHQPSFFFLPLLFQILSVIFMCALPLLSPCNASSNARQEPHSCSSINSPLICSICFSPASCIVLRVCVLFLSLTSSH